MQFRLRTTPAVFHRSCRVAAYDFAAVVVVCLAASIGGSAAADDFVQPAPLAPEIAEASSEAADGLSVITIPDGWQISLFAAEPDVANVVAFDIDNRGRFFICETFRQNRGVTDNRGHDDKWLLADLSAQTVQDRIDYHKRLLGEGAVTYAQNDDRIRRVVDTDGDGRADQSTVLVDGFNHIEEGTGAGVLARGDEVYYTCIPKLWKIIDKDDDGKADDRVVLSDGYGVRVAFRGHDMHGLVIGPDGRLYFSIGDRGYHLTTDDGRVLADPASGAVFRCELDGTGLEVYCTGVRNPQELAFNDLGDFFSVDNNSDSGDQARIVHLLQGGDTGWRMYYQYLPDRGPFNREKLWYPKHEGQPSYIVPPIANFTDGPSGLAYYPGTGFGDALNDTFLICDFRGGPSNSGIRSFKLEPDGAFYKLTTDAQPVWTCLATDAAFGPDGALYVSDWVDGWNGLGKGRVYRLHDPQHSGSEIVKAVQALLAGDWQSYATTDLSAQLGHVDRRIRLESQWELARRGEVEALLAVASDSSADSKARLHAVWGADQIARVDSDKRTAVLDGLRPLLADADGSLKAAVVKVAGERDDQTAVKAVRGLINDASPRVRYFAALAAAQLKDAGAIEAVVNLMVSNAGADPALRHATMMYLDGAVSEQGIAKLASHSDESVRLAAVVALRRQGSGTIAEFLADESELVRDEAARAIHDAPIPVALESLAELITSDSLSGDTGFRVLNANYRIGTAASAAALAQFASAETSPEPLRIKALEMLKAWRTPDPRDLVINDFRPLEPRPVTDARAALTPEIDRLTESQPAIRDAAIDTASTLGIAKIAPMLIKRVINSEISGRDRAASLRALGRLDRPNAVKAAKAVPAASAGPLFQAALEILAENNAADSAALFVAATESKNVGIRQYAWDVLASIDSKLAKTAIAKAVGSYLAGKLDGEVHLNVLEAAAKSLPADVNLKIAEARAETAKTDPLAEWLPAMDGGDVAAGEKIFMEKTQLSCVRCHKVDRAGGEVGPELTLIGRTKDRRYLLEAICLPNAQVAKGFETAVIVDYDGIISTGIVKSETDDLVELIQADGSQVRIKQDDIELRKKGNSSMPGDLIKFMTVRELRDLVAYLKNLQFDRNEEEVE